MKRITIFFFTKDHRGGMETFLKQMKNLNEKKFEKRFFYFKKENLVEYHEDDFFLNENYPIELQFTFGKVFLFFNNLFKTFRVVIRDRPDILFTCDIYSYTIAAFVNFLLLKGKLVHLFNNNFYLIINNRKAGALYKKLILKTFYHLSRLSNVIVFTSSELMKFTLKTMLYKSVYTKNIPNSVDFIRLKKLLKESINKRGNVCWLKNGLHKVMSVGRLDGQKDFATVLRSFQIISTKKPNSVLIIIGDGCLRQDLENLSRKLKIYDKTYFLGWKKNIFKYLKYADVFVFSSHYEGFAQVIVEAMACKVPVIATDSPFGPKEILENGKYGVIVPVGDYKSMSEKAINMLSDNTYRGYYANKGFIRARNFETKKMLREYEDLFINIAKGERL